MSEHGRHVVFYDGVCGLCSRLNAFVIARDPGGVFAFEPLQGEVARETLARFGADSRDLDTFFLLADRGTAEERLLARSDAALRVFAILGGGWRLLAWLRCVPRGVRDRVYRFIARSRYSMFGKSEVCRIPRVRSHASRRGSRE